MIYRVIGLMSGSSLDGLDVVFTELEDNRGVWNYTLKAADCIEYTTEWKNKLANANNLNACNYLLLDVAYGKFLAEAVNRFIEDNNLYHQVQLIVSHGHTVFHAPEKNMTAQLGNGATIAALTGINVVNDLRMMDVALGGQGAPIVPVGEKLLFPGFDFYLNIGGIANLSFNNKKEFIAFDVCTANRVLNMLAQNAGKDFDEDGALSSKGVINNSLLDTLNKFDYYKTAYPKSLSNSFGTGEIYPLIQSFFIKNEDALRTYTEHIALQVQQSVQQLINKKNNEAESVTHKLFVTGGGAFNKFLISVLKEKLLALNIDTVIPEDEIVSYKEALIMALLGVLRWREENTVLGSVTGAARSSIGGAVWIGQEA